MTLAEKKKQGPLVQESFYWLHMNEDSKALDIMYTHGAPVNAIKRKLCHKKSQASYER